MVLLLLRFVFIPRISWNNLFLYAHVERVNIQSIG